MPRPPSPSDYGIELESADDFVARMRAKDAAAEPDTAVTPIGESPRRRRTGWRVAAVAASVVAITGLAVFRPWDPDTAVADSPPILNYELAKASNIAFAPGADARPDLLAVAAAASRTSDRVAPDGADVEYVQTDNWFAQSEDDGKSFTSTIVPTAVQTWTGADGAQTVVQSPGSPLRRDGRGLTAVDDDPVVTDQQIYPPGNAGPNPLAGADLTPAQVRRNLLASGDCESETAPTVRAQCLYQEVVSAFDQRVVPSQTASALWTALSDETGFRTLGTVTDRAGRPGVGISVISSDRPEFRSVLIISRSTGQLLGQEEIRIKSDPDRGLKAPAVNTFTAILVSRYTSDRPLPR